MDRSTSSSNATRAIAIARSCEGEWLPTRWRRCAPSSARTSFVCARDSPDLIRTAAPAFGAWPSCGSRNLPPWEDIGWCTAPAPGREQTAPMGTTEFSRLLGSVVRKKCGSKRLPYSIYRVWGLREHPHLKCCISKTRAGLWWCPKPEVRGAPQLPPRCQVPRKPAPSTVVCTLDLAPGVPLRAGKPGEAAAAQGVNGCIVTCRWDNHDAHHGLRTRFVDGREGQGAQGDPLCHPLWRL